MNNLVKDNSKDNNGQNDSEDQQQAAALVASCLLVPRGLSVFNVSLARIFSDIFHSVSDRAQLLPLLVHNLRYLSEEDVQVTDTLLNIADLFLTLNNESFLEVDLVLRCEYDALFLLLKLLQLCLGWSALRALAFLCRTSGGN
jgi:hypothetical protein